MDDHQNLNESTSLTRTKAGGSGGGDGGREGTNEETKSNDINLLKPSNNNSHHHHHSQHETSGGAGKSKGKFCLRTSSSSLVNKKNEQNARRSIGEPVSAGNRHEEDEALENDEDNEEDEEEDEEDEDEDDEEDENAESSRQKAKNNESNENDIKLEVVNKKNSDPQSATGGGGGGKEAFHLNGQQPNANGNSEDAHMKTTTTTKAN